MSTVDEKWKLNVKTSKSAALIFTVTTKSVRGSKHKLIKKVFPRPEFVEGMPLRIGETDFYRKRISDIKGVEYEKKVYAQIQRELINTRKCGYFVGGPSPKVSSSADITYNFLVEKLGGRKNESVLLESLFNIVYRTRNNSSADAALVRDAARTREGDIGAVMGAFRLFNFSQLTTNYVPNHVSLADFIGTGLITTTVSSSSPCRSVARCSIRDYPDLAKVVFQVLVGCFALGTRRIESNDLHDQNVLVQTVPMHSARCIVKSRAAGGKTLVDVTFNTSHKALIFDWDFAHSSKIGKNEKLNDSGFCKMVHDCNSIVDLVPDKQKVRTSILRNMVVVVAWLSYCARPSSRTTTVMRDWARFLGLIMAIDSDEKRAVLQAVYRGTCISNIDGVAGSTPYVRAKTGPNDDPLGMGDKIKTGEFFLDPIIYAPGEVFKDPVEILQLLGSMIGGGASTGASNLEANLVYA